jgi:hypothetical protein
VERALALGLTRRKAIAGVIFPQALRLAIPPLASQYMNLIKNSSLAVVIGYPTWSRSATLRSTRTARRSRSSSSSWRSTCRSTSSSRGDGRRQRARDARAAMNGSGMPAAPRVSLLDSARRRFFYSPGASLVTFAAAALLAWQAGWRSTGR